jgi:MFS family permease
MSTFFESFQSNIYHEYGIADENVGYIFGSQCFTYAVGCIVIPKLIKSYPRKLVLASSFLFFATTLLLTGPSNMLGLPQSIYLILMGFPMSGFASAVFFIPVFPELIERTQLRYKVVDGEDEELDAKLNDQVSNMYGVIYNTAGFVGPLVGGLIFEFVGYSRTYDYMAITCLIAAVVMFFFNDGPTAYQEDKSF